MDCRKDGSCNLKRNLGFRLHDVINTKEQTVLKSVKDAFEIAFHESGHADRNLSNETERQKALEKELDCVFIRINPDEENFNIFKEINKIHKQIKKTTKKSLIGDLSKRLLELEFKSNHSIKSNCLKWVVKKILPRIEDMKNAQSKMKPIKTGKEIGIMYCLGCEDYTGNVKTQKVKIRNKMLIDKPNCIVCRSSKSRLKKNNTATENNSARTLILKPIKTNYKTWIFIAKTAENTLNALIQKC